MFDRPATLLRTGAGVIGALGLTIMIWLADKAIRFPGIRAAQFENDAPLWLPMIAFVALCTAGMCYVFIRAARRMDAGEEVYENRYHRRPDR